MKRQEKLDIIIRLLSEGGGRFTAQQLLDAAGSHRRARSALFLSRKNGVTLEALRDEGEGRTVVSYVAMNYDSTDHSWMAFMPDSEEKPEPEVIEIGSGWKKREEYSAA
jgi:hypothetical protein